MSCFLASGKKSFMISSTHRNIQLQTHAHTLSLNKHRLKHRQTSTRTQLYFQSLTHSLIHSFSQTFTFSLNHSPTNSLIHSIAPSLARSCFQLLSQLSTHNHTHARTKTLTDQCQKLKSFRRKLFVKNNINLIIEWLGLLLYHYVETIFNSRAGNLDLIRNKLSYTFRSFSNSIKRVLDFVWTIKRVLEFDWKIKCILELRLQP